MINKMDTPKRITIFVGYYGSGKTEIAVNYALQLRKSGKKVVIVDFDIVNPYFRTKDAEEILHAHGIQVIAPAFANTNLENPGIPPEIYSIFTDKDTYAIFDVGGGEDGAIPLGRYYPYLKDEDYNLFFVLNERRMITKDIDGALDAFMEIAAVTRIPVTGIINNTHLKQETTPDMLLQGQLLAEELAKKTNLPIVAISGKEEMLKSLPKEYQLLAFPIQTYINLLF